MNLKLQLQNRQNTYFRLYHTAKPPLLHAKWNGFVTSDEIESAYEQTLGVIAATRCPYILNNHTDIVGSWDDSIDWISFVWAPEAVRMGLRKFAHVLPNDIFAIAAAQELLRKLEGYNLEIALFKSEKPAKEWLLREKAPIGI